MDGLERRYRRLLVAYPVGYRQRRADEIVGTFLAAAAPGQRRPSLADAADLVAGGLRQRLGLGAAADLAAGGALAGPVALALASGLAGFLWLTVEGGTVGGTGHRTTGPVAYAAWLLALAGWAVLPVRYARWPVAGAMAVTALVLPVAVLTGTGRPPLWVVLGLLAFGALAVAGPPPRSATARAAVVTGALVTAALTRALLAAEVPASRWPTAYYHPAIGLSGIVVTVAVVGVAAAAVPALLQGRRARPWLWAALLLALPGGWLGPRTGPVAVPDTRPGFGRLAEVLLATCVVLAAMAALTGVRAVAGGLDRAGAVALGCAAGLAGFLWWLGPGSAAYAGWLGAALAYPLLPASGRRLAVAAALGLTIAAPGGPPWSALVTLGLLGSLALVAPAGRAWYPLPVAVATAAAAAVVAAYDNGWRLTGWPASPHTGVLVLTLAIVPFAAAAVGGARALHTRRFAAVAALLAGAGWIGALAVPHLRAWGPVLILLPFGVVVFAGRARTAAHRELTAGRHAGLLALARAVCPDGRSARRLTVATLASGGGRATGGALRAELVRAALDLPPGRGRDPLSAAVHALPADQRVALALRYRAELPVPEIAALLGCAPQAARDLIADGLRALPTSGPSPARTACRASRPSPDRA